MLSTLLSTFYNSLYWTLRKIQRLFIVAFAHNTAYRAEIVIWMISGIFPLIMMFVWMGLAEAGPLSGYTKSDFAAYFLIMFLVRQMTVSWVVWELDRQIRLGELSPKLLRPIDPFWEHLWSHLSERIIRLVFVLPLLGTAFYFLDIDLKLTLAKVLSFVLALSLAFTIRFNRQYSVGLLTFWTDQATALEQVWFLFYTVLGGAVIPFDLFPEGLKAVLVYTPFPYILDFPVKILLGKISGAAMWQSIAIQCVWAVLFISLRLVMWRQGLKRYGAVGA